MASSPSLGAQRIHHPLDGDLALIAAGQQIRLGRLALRCQIGGADADQAVAPAGAFGLQQRQGRLVERLGELGRPRAAGASGSGS